MVSPTFSLYCHYLPCTHTTDAAAGLIISSLPQSCTSKIAMKGAWQTTLDVFFSEITVFSTPSERRIHPIPLLSTYCSLPLLFQSAFLTLTQRQRQRSKHLCCSSLRVTQKICTQNLRSTIWPKPPQLNIETNARIKIHTTPDTA